MTDLGGVGEFPNDSAKSMSISDDKSRRLWGVDALDRNADSPVSSESIDGRNER